MADWIKFHRALTKGTKRGLSRATRFIYCELCLEARELDGFVKLPASMDTSDAVHDLIGGNRDEVVAAVSQLIQEHMVCVSDDGTLSITGWDTWAKADTSTERVRRFREKQREESRETDETFLSRPREEKSREENTNKQNKPARAAAPMSDKARQIREGLDLAADLFTDCDLDAAAVRIQRALSMDLRADKLDLRLLAAEAAKYARSWFAEHPLAEPAKRLAEAERKAGWLVGSMSAPKMRPTPIAGIRGGRSDATGNQDQAGGIDWAQVRADAAKADADQARAAERAKKDREGVDPKEMADVVKRQLEKMRKGA